MAHTSRDEEQDELFPNENTVVTNVGEDEDEDDDGARLAPIAAKRRPRASPAETDSPIAESIFGVVPKSVHDWRILKRSLHGDFVRMSWAAPGATLKIDTFPLDDLNEETIRTRWGAGTYRVEWRRPDNRVLRGGKTVEILDPVRDVPSAALEHAPSSSVFGPEVDRTFAMMQLIDQQSTAKMSQVMQFAAALATANGGGNGGGLTADRLELILAKQAENTAKIVAAAIAPIAAEMATLRRELDEGEDDDEGGAASAIAAAVPQFIKGKGGFAQFANFMAGNPELVKVGLPIAAEALGKVAAIFTPPPPPRPRAVPIVPDPYQPPPQALHVEAPAPPPASVVPPPLVEVPS